MPGLHLAGIVTSTISTPVTAAAMPADTAMPAEAAMPAGMSEAVPRPEAMMEAIVEAMMKTVVEAMMEAVMEVVKPTAAAIELVKLEPDRAVRIAVVIRR
jgi:hypothetical protein